MIRSAEQSLRELCAVGGSGASLTELGEAISQAIAPAVAHDALRLMGTSPTAGFVPASFSFWHRYDPDLGLALVHSSHAGEDPCSLAELARRPVPVGIAGAGGGDGRRDRAARRLLSTYGVGGKLRVLLRDARGVWGALDLLRAQGGQPFDDDDIHRAVRLAPILLAFLRGYVTAGPLTPTIPALPTGVMIVGPDHVLRAATPQAHQWRKQLRTHHQSALDCTSASHRAALSLQARKQLHDPRTYLPLVLAPAASHGRWITIAGQPLDDTGTGDVAIIIQAATREQLLPSFCDWYGITARERQIIEHLSDAAAAKQIARRLDISVHTVNDHLRSVFRKTGANSRDELIAAMST